MNITEHSAECTGKPEQADFAVLDLAQQDEGLLMGWLYSHFDPKEIPWAALYQGSGLDAGWASGPILIELRGFEEFHNALTERYETGYFGVLLHAPETTLAQMARHLRSLIIVELGNKPALFRFYDPRGLGPLLDVLNPAQQQRLSGPATQWSWYQYQNWRQWRVSVSTIEHDRSHPLVISDLQRRQIDAARSQRFATTLAQTYRAHITFDNAQTFVMNELQAAQCAGLSNLADQERWLRMAIKVQGPLTESKQWCQIADDSARAAIQILSQLECEQGRNAC